MLRLHVASLNDAEAPELPLEGVQGPGKGHCWNGLTHADFPSGPGRHQETPT